MPSSKGLRWPDSNQRGPLILWFGFLLLSSVVVLLICGQALVLLNPKAKAAAAKWKTSKTAHILFLGNSQHRNLNANVFDHSILNVSIGGADYSILSAVLRGLGRKLSNLEVVILGYDNLLLRTPAIQRRNGDYEELLQWGIPWYAIPETSAYERLLFYLTHNALLKPVLTGPKLDQPQLEHILSWSGIIRWLDVKKASAASLDPMYGPSPFSQVIEKGPKRDVNSLKSPYGFTPAQGKEKMASYVRALKRNHNIECNSRAFLEIVHYCREHNLKLILLRTPTTRAFRENRPEDWTAELDQLYLNAVELFGSSIPIWNEEFDLPYEDEWFDDPNHLITYYIHHLLSPRINARLKELDWGANL